MSQPKLTKRAYDEAPQPHEVKLHDEDYEAYYVGVEQGIRLAMGLLHNADKSGFTFREQHWNAAVDLIESELLMPEEPMPHSCERCGKHPVVDGTSYCKDCWEPHAG